MRSARVDFPWSMWAMMQKFRRTAGSVRPGAGADGMGTANLRKNERSRTPQFFHAARTDPDSPTATRDAVGRTSDSEEALPPWASSLWSSPVVPRVSGRRSPFPARGRSVPGLLPDDAVQVVRVVAARRLDVTLDVVLVGRVDIDDLVPFDVLVDLEAVELGALLAHRTPPSLSGPAGRSRRTLPR